MVTVKNLTNSPYDLPTVDGFVRLPAFGEVDGDFTDDYVHLLESSMAVKIMKAEEKSSPKRNNAAKSAKAAKSVDPALTKLRKDYAELTGKKPFGGWGAEELQKRIDTVLAG